ncbi:MAG: hypothetical protein K1X53_12595 [Candidatus Sumerlaeaceae bacterium]|nr:hypothetical protein [Candidatus Sumerlaeaceae bacterium]
MIQTAPKRTRWMAPVVGLTLALFALTACDKDEYEINQDWSINVFKPGPKWPIMKNMKPLEKEVFGRFGKPDAFHVLWSPDGTIKSRSELDDRGKEVQKAKTLPPYTWVYAGLGKEIYFSPTTYTEKPIRDDLRLIMKYGDPEDVKDQGNIKQWTFYSVGKMYKISNGKIIDEKDFPAMGRFTKM